MNKVAKLAVGGAVVMLVATATAAWADDAPAPKPQVSAAAGKDLQAAQKALTAKNYDEAIADLDKVKANSKKNEYDEYLMNEFYFSAYAGAKKFTGGRGAARGRDGLQVHAPGRAEAAPLPWPRRSNYQLKDYGKAIDFGNRAVKDGYAHRAVAIPSSPSPTT